MSDSYNLYYVLEDEITEPGLERLVDHLDERATFLRPSDGDVPDYVETLSGDWGSIRVEYRDTVFSLIVNPDGNELIERPFVMLKIDERWILPVDGESDSEAIDRMDALYVFFGDLYEELVDAGVEPAYVVGFNFAEQEKAGNPEHVIHVDAERLLDGDVPGIFWFQILPPAVVERVGADRLLSAPAFRAERCSDGAVLLAVDRGVNTSDPFQHSTEAVSEHLDIPWERGQV